MEPRDLVRADEPAAIAALAEAFADDPLFIRLFGGLDSGLRVKNTRTLLRGVIGMNRWSGGLRWVVDAPDPDGAAPAGRIAGVAIVDRPRIGWTRAMDGPAALRFLPAALTLSRQSLRMVNRYGAAVTGSAPRVPHHYLTMIGVRAAYQRRGIASALLAAVVDSADAHPGSAGVALDTENEENVAIYEHKGFRVTSRPDVDGMPMYCMFRPSREAAR